MKHKYSDVVEIIAVILSRETNVDELNAIASDIEEAVYDAGYSIRESAMVRPKDIRLIYDIARKVIK